MSKEIDETESIHEQESSLMDLKVKKTRKRAAFTRTRNWLHSFLEDEDSEKELLRETLDKLESAMVEATDVITTIAEFYKSNKRTAEMIKTLDEIETLQTQYDETMILYHSFGSNSNKSYITPPAKEDISTDMYKQLKRVAIPVFTGNKKQYRFWKAAFDTCIDSTNATPEYKFLQLRQYIAGDALKAIDGLGHSALAYESAKERLDRKFGGARRNVNRFLEELDKFPAIKYENAKIIERFADLLDIVVINMKENETKDLESNFMYYQLLKMMPEPMISKFERWVFENCKKERVETLKEWVLQESEFYNIALETKHGLDFKGSHDPEKKRDYSHFVGNISKKRVWKRECKVCGANHGVWDCDVMKSLPIEERWNKAKTYKLCFRCLGENHAGRECRRVKVCGINGCRKVHHALLHNTQFNPTAQEFKPERTEQNQSFTSVHSQSNYVALRTIPVILEANGKKLKVNALLDDGSTQSYINRSVAAELGLPMAGQMYDMTVNTLNGRQESLKTMSVTFGLESLNGQLKMQFTANVVDNVTGDLQTLELNKLAHKWEHLKSIKFPEKSRNAYWT